MTFAKTTQNNLESHCNSLCDHDKQRARTIIMCTLEISEPTFYRYLKQPETISKPDKYFISQVFDIEPKQLFNS